MTAKKIVSDKGHAAGRDVNTQGDVTINMIGIAPVGSRKSRSSAVTQSIKGNGNHQSASGRGGVNQSIQGDNNTQTNNHVTVQSRTTKIEISPPIGSIGANPALRIRIEGLIKDINEARYKRLGKKFNFQAIYGALADQFKLGQKGWKTIWLWDESRADEVINWLQSQMDNTIDGRIQKAAKHDGYKHTRGHLFRLEKDYINQLGWSDAQTQHVRLLMSGQSSRADMTDEQFRNWVAHLRTEVLRMYGEI